MATELPHGSGSDWLGQILQMLIQIRIGELGRRVDNYSSLSRFFGHSWAFYGGATTIRVSLPHVDVLVTESVWVMHIKWHSN